MMAELLEKQAHIMEELSSLCRELMTLLAQYTDIEAYENAMEEIAREQAWTMQH